MEQFIKKYIDPTFGFMNARIQTWFPFSIQVCFNGREWLARQMDSLGIHYRRSDNCFTWIYTIKEAQTIHTCSHNASLVPIQNVKLWRGFLVNITLQQLNKCVA